MKIFIFNGQGGVGKTTFQNMIISKLEKANRSWEQISMVTPVKRMANLYFGWREEDKTPEARLMLHRLKIMLDDWNQMPMNWIEYAIRANIDYETEVLFIDAREPKDINKLKELYPDLKTVLVVRGDKKDYGNDADNGVFDYQYDYTIDNSGDLATLETLADVFIKRMINNE